MTKNVGLGKGLDAIFIENEGTHNNRVVMMRTAQIEPNREQPRRKFRDEGLYDLAQSIAQHGILQPIIVRPVGDNLNTHQIIAGERRWRASRMAGLQEIPVLVKETDASETMEFALIENLQREDLSVLEEARGYKALIENHGFSQEQVARSVSKSRPVVANALRILNLPDEVLEQLESGQLTACHARALLSLKDRSKICEVGQLVVKKELKVNELERLCKKMNEEAERGKVGQEEGARDKSLTADEVFFREVEVSLKLELGRRVRVKNHPKRAKGVIEIEYNGRDDLAKIARMLGNESEEEKEW